MKEKEVDEREDKKEEKGRGAVITRRRTDGGASKRRRKEKMRYLTWSKFPRKVGPLSAQMPHLPIML